jgi:hypothetical protein
MEMIPKNCWLDDEPGYSPSPCVFDDPGECIEDCVYASQIQRQGKLKDSCKYYRDTKRSGIFRHFDEQCWPCPGEEMDNLSYTMRYGVPTKEDFLVAASIIDAYGDIVRATQKKRNTVIKELTKSGQ